MNIALFSPNKNPYSETFIQAHKNNLKDNVYYYYGRDDIAVEDRNIRLSLLHRTLLKIKAKLFKKPTNYLKNKILLNSFKQFSIDVILVEYGNHANSILQIIKQSKLPLVVHFHGYDASVFEVINNANNYKDLFDYAKKIIVVSKIMKKMILDLGCPKEKLILNIYGPKSEFEHVKPLFNKKQFIAVGRFTNKKAPYYTILAFKKVLKKFPDTKLLFAGDGTLKECCENLVNYFGLNENIKFLGVITSQEFQSLLSESLAFVQHSIIASNGDMEGTPLSILEASISGLPVISTFHAGIQDVILHNETGLLSLEHDVDAMAKHMEAILSDKNQAKKMGAKGKQYVKSEFSLERHIKSLQETLISVTQ